MKVVLSVLFSVMLVSLFATACSVVQVADEGLPQKGIVQCVIGGQVIGCQFTSLVLRSVILDVNCSDGGRLLLPASSCIVVRPSALSGAVSSTDARAVAPGHATGT